MICRWWFISAKWKIVTFYSFIWVGHAMKVIRYWIMTRLAKALTEMGYTYFDWNVDSDDAGRARTPEEVFKNITKGLRSCNDAVVLQHDTKEYSVDAVERVIAWALVKGYRFAPLTEDSPTCHHPINN